MKDSFGRSLTYLRISVTDRCDGHCVYCKPRAAREPLSWEKLCRLSKIFAELGIEHVRITGGEPLLRDGVTDFAAYLKNLAGIKTVTLTTNASTLDKHLSELERAKIDGINISLDAISNELYPCLAGATNSEKIISNIKLAASSEIPVKLNAVLIRPYWEEQIRELSAFALSIKTPLRFIELMPFGPAGELEGVPGDEADRYLEKLYGKGELSSAPGFGPAFYKTYPNGLQAGFIDALTHNYCADCRRLRLLSDGRLKLCLHQQAKLDLGRLADEMNDNEIKEAILKEIKNKQERHSFGLKEAEKESLAEIGG